MIKDALRILTLNPMWRIKRHADYLAERVDIDDEIDAANFLHVLEAVDKTISRLHIYYWIRFVLFVMLYVSAISAFITGINPELQVLLDPIRGLAGLIGFSVLTVLVLLFSKLISAVLEDLRTAHAHLVSLAVKHSKAVLEPEHKLGLYMHYR